MRESCFGRIMLWIVKIFARKRDGKCKIFINFEKNQKIDKKPLAK